MIQKKIIIEDTVFPQGLPIRVKYFSQINISRKIILEDTLPDIKQIISSIIDYEVVSIKIIETTNGISCEGKYSSGQKALVELKFKEKIMYISDTIEQSVHIMESEFYYTVSVIVPRKIEGEEVKKLVESNLLKNKLQIECSTVKSQGKRTIIRYIFFLLELYVTETFRLCFSVHEKNKSNIFISYEDGSRALQQTFDENYKNVKPVWGSDRDYLVFISNKSGAYMLNMLDIKAGKIKEITSPSTFKNINSFCLFPKGRKIIFSAEYKDESNLFCLDIQTLKHSQLTFSKLCEKKYRPKCSNDGKRIAFLTEANDKRNLCIMDIDGFNYKNLTFTGDVRDFNWSYDDNFIVYIEENSFKVCKLSLLDLGDLHETNVNLDKSICKIHSAVYSPINNFIAFVGDNLTTEDVYIFIAEENKVLNITHNQPNVRIKSIAWKQDDSKIYYCSNELKYYNLYSIYLSNLYKKQLTNIESSNIELCYKY